MSPWPGPPLLASPPRRPTACAPRTLHPPRWRPRNNSRAAHGPPQTGLCSAARLPEQLTCPSRVESRSRLSPVLRRPSTTSHAPADRFASKHSPIIIPPARGPCLVRRRGHEPCGPGRDWLGSLLGCCCCCCCCSQHFAALAVKISATRSPLSAGRQPAEPACCTQPVPGCVRRRQWRPRLLLPMHAIS